MTRPVWTAGDVLALGTSTDLVTAGSVLGISRSKCYQLARGGRFPVPVVRVGKRYVVPTAPLRALLRIDGTPEKENDGTA